MKEIAIGIDIGGTNTKFGLVDKDGETLFQKSIPTRAEGDVNEFFKDLQESIQGALKNFPDVDIKGVGIGAPNANYYKQTIEHAPNIRWGTIVPFGEIFKKYFKYPMVMTNDANAAAIGEMVYGSAKGMKDFIVITLGTGLGSGIVVNGQLVYGHDGFAGELGHVIVNPNGRYCGCGRKGCLETYVSATGIKRTVFKLLADYTYKSELRAIAFDDLTAEFITQAAMRKDPIAIAAFEYTGRILGIKLADTMVHTSPEAIFLFGGLVKAGDYIFKPTLEHMEKNMFPVFKNKLKLIPSGLMDKNAAVLGAAALVWKEFETP
ncbi:MULTISPECIES: ROK family protein [unclassified Imperialibacter]|uniref:ROK family protein n=1 Tax=unclassified Imperialibacter TaxID=2629706 RepID=UPI00125A0BB1|nr:MULTISPECIES: ROK family protein [unclassified Imperialibacter]CAD5256733.1 Glucokinase [Imperialibacter sp. 89]CAD5271728.1 Glucokinase [Imperialibacter sp. 75]VVT19154.1 Glucokinase [Imperialibacter sp. EC-SDR9]